MCDVRAAWWATRMCALGCWRLRMQSIQFCRCAMEPSAFDGITISGGGVSVPGAYGASSL